MAKLSNGFNNLNTQLLSWSGDDLAKQVFDFGKHGEFYTYDNLPYDPTDSRVIQVIEDVMSGTTFPKYALEGHRLSFKVNDISRICLAQFTREKGFFCSQSGAVRPLSQEIIIPMSVHNNPNWTQRIHEAMRILEDVYIDMCSEGIPYMDSRYIMPHGQAISLSYSCTPAEFVRSCSSRTRNNFGDEINMLYRCMLQNIKDAISTLHDPLSIKLWNWLIKDTISDKPFLDVTYCNGFAQHKLPNGYKFKSTAHCDWRKSGWKLELQRLNEQESPLLTGSDINMIDSWENELESNYNPNEKFTPEQAIKEMDYYDERRKRI